MSLIIQSLYKGRIFTKDNFNSTTSYSETFFMNTRSSGISALKMHATAAEMQHNKTFSKLTNPLDQKGLVVQVGPGARCLHQHEDWQGHGISLVTNTPQLLGRAGGPSCLVSDKCADEKRNSNSAGIPEVIGRAGEPGSRVSAGGADKDTSSFSTSSLCISRAGGRAGLVSTGGTDESTSSSSAIYLGIGRVGAELDLSALGAQMKIRALLLLVT